MLEHVEKTLDELREHRAGVVTYLEHIDNCIDVLCKMNAVTAESERLVKGGPEPDKAVTGGGEKPPTKKKARSQGSRSKSGLPKGVFRLKYAGDKPDRFEARVWDGKKGKKGKNVRLGSYDTIEEAADVATKARNNVALKKATAKAAKKRGRPSGPVSDEPAEPTDAKKGGTSFKCKGCSREYKVKPQFCQTCAHKEFVVTEKSD